MKIVSRGISIGALAAILALIPWALARSAEPLTLLLFALPVTAFTAPFFMIASIVWMFYRQRRRHIADGKDAYRYRVRRHYITWAVLTVLAWIASWLFLTMLAEDKDVSGEGNGLFALVIAGPTLILGMIASTIVERVYERVLEKGISES